eukprot:TRINITY_DN23001_c0_g1_i1.p1 TRINITY_DN23001_c0_g1~~TRINITY_DN23001_c0_g1_i1.p1  ORF type:complete len:187 (+),score=16.99 TRINITY_DN23001_c0_g1_i1:143-703(+)
MCSDHDPIQRRRVQPRPKDVINLKVVTAGDSGVGKSTLVRGFCEGGTKGPTDCEPTVGADFQVRTFSHAGKEFRMNIFDASGDIKFAEVRNEFYKDTQGVLLFYDITSRRSFQALERWTDEISRHSQGTDPRVVLVGTKTDLNPRAVQEQAAKDWAKCKGYPHFEVSAIHGQNLEIAFKELASRLS